MLCYNIYIPSPTALITHTPNNVSHIMLDSHMLNLLHEQIYL